MSQTDEKLILPQDFCKRMENLLCDEYPDFLKNYEKKRLYGLRLNPLKTSREKFLEQMPFTLKEILWTPDGFYYP